MKTEDVIQELGSGTVCPRCYVGGIFFLLLLFLTAQNGQRGKAFSVEQKIPTFQRTGWRDISIIHAVGRTLMFIP